MARCRFCRAEMVWAVAEFTRTPMPVNAERVPNGNLVLQHRPGGGAPVAHVLTKQEREEHERQSKYRVETLGHKPEDTWLFIEHHASCPAAARVDAGELHGQEVLF